MDNLLTQDTLQGLLVFLSFALAAKLAMPTIGLCRKLGLKDMVSGRSLHKKESIRGGGILFVGLSLVLLPLALLTSPAPNFVWQLAILSFIVALAGLLDDMKNLPIRYRLPVQMVCVAIATALLPVFCPALPLWLEKSLLFFAYIWFVNLYNFMDGLDGLAATQGLVISLFLSLIAIPFVGAWPLVIAGTLMGFLGVNWPPARIFMGDVGSTWLGFTLGGLLLFTAGAGLASGIEGNLGSIGYLWAGLIISSLFWADATFTLCKRILKKEKFWQGHRSHFYQQAHLMGLTQKQVMRRAVGLFILNFIFAIFALAMPMYGAYFLAAVLAVLTVVAARIHYLKG